jgi:hypothetical protein
MHKTFIFFLPDPGAVSMIPHQEYVRVVRGEQPMPGFMGRKIRVADWYVSMADAQPVRVENETYSYLRFDERGYVVWLCDTDRSDAYRALVSATGPSRPNDAKELAWQPTHEEKARLHEMVFQASKE